METKKIGDFTQFWVKYEWKKLEDFPCYTFINLLIDYSNNSNGG